jgi:hypothetical protein
MTRFPLRQAWTAFRRPGRLIALAAAGLTLVAFGLLFATGSRSSCDGPCPPLATTADGTAVSDQFWFAHRDLGPEGSITVRLASMTGTITYPPPDHDEIVPGLVPWAKTGIIVKDGLGQGSAYAALMMTGEHGVRMQHGYVHDIAGDTASLETPVWLRLTRSGDTITGYESADGETWEQLGTAVLDGLPETVQVGLFATSPGDLTLRKVALGGSLPESRFTQAVGRFDHIGLEGAADGGWAGDSVGEMNHTDWEKDHNASGLVEEGDVLTVSGTGDIGPSTVEGVGTVDRLLIGLPFALIVMLVPAARFGATSTSRPRRDLAAREAVLGMACGAIGLVAVGALIPVSVAILRGNDVPVEPVAALTVLRIAVGLAAVFGLSAVLAFGLGVLLRRGWAGIVAALALVALPFAVATLPVLPDAVAQWLLRVSPAAAFAVKQTLVEYPQVTAHYAPSDGYFPLPGWAGLAVLCAYVLGAAWAVRRRRTAV